ncbi:hypothetical protein J4Q44_G00072990 [Coregonus suidteri]|uniref:Uncharacterized protein n=1 Tax=Coregonus suidteri TaxID=861788 RepID=A0AAN8RCU9_9TELE
MRFTGKHSKHFNEVSVFRESPLQQPSLNTFSSRVFVDASTLKKRRQSVLDQLGGFSQQGAVYNVLGVCSSLTAERV